MSDQGSYTLGFSKGLEDCLEGLPKRESIPDHLKLSLSEQAHWWAGYHKGYIAV